MKNLIERMSKEDRLPKVLNVGKVHTKVWGSLVDITTELKPILNIKG